MQLSTVEQLNYLTSWSPTQIGAKVRECTCTCMQHASRNREVSIVKQKLFTNVSILYNKANHNFTSTCAVFIGACRPGPARPMPGQIFQIEMFCFDLSL